MKKPAPIDIQSIIDKGLRAIDSEIGKILVQSETYTDVMEPEDIKCLTSLIKATLEIQADKRAEHITASQAQALSDEQLANEIQKLMKDRSKRAPSS